MAQIDLSRAGNGRHDGVAVSSLGSRSRYPRSRLGRVNCAEALSPHYVAAVGKLLTLTFLSENCSSFTFILTSLSSDCGMPVVFNKRILLLLLTTVKTVTR